MLLWTPLGSADRADVDFYGNVDKNAKEVLILAKKTFSAADYGFASGVVKNALKGRSVLETVITRRKPWDPVSLTRFSLTSLSFGSAVSGIAIPHLWIPAVALMTYNIPFVRDTLDRTLYGRYLDGPNSEYLLDELTASKSVANPYLLCNLYESSQALAAGEQAELWSFVKREHLSEPRGLSFYHNYVYVPGRWLQRLGPKGREIRFASLVNPSDLYLACVLSFFKRSAITRSQQLKLVVPQVGYSRWTRSYPLIHYAPMARIGKGEIVQEKAVLLLSPETSAAVDGSYRGKATLSRVLKDASELETLLPTPVNPFRFLSATKGVVNLFNEVKGKVSRGEKFSVAEIAETGLAAADIYRLSLTGITDSQLPHVSKAALLLGIYDFGRRSNLISMESFYGEYLYGLRASYRAQEFRDPKRLQSSYVACHYYAEGEDPKRDEPKAWQWLNDANGKTARITGRWIWDTAKYTYYFASTVSRKSLVKRCQRVLNANRQFAALPSSEALKRIRIYAGNNSVSQYAVFFFFGSDLEGGAARDSDEVFLLLPEL